MKLKDKKILVTGGNSFLGKSLVPLLEKEEAKIKIFSSNEYNLRERNDVKRLFNKANPEIVIHLAVDNGGIIYTKENPGSILYNNLLMNTLVQEESRIKGIEKFVGIGSISSYPTSATSPLNEKSLWNGYPEEIHAPIGLAKLMMLAQSQAYSKQYKFNAIHLIPVNLYGPNYNLNPNTLRVTTIFMQKMLDAKKNNEKELELTGTPDTSKEFLYVEDCAKGIILATKLYDNPFPVNLGSGKTIKISDLAEKIKEVVDYKGKLIWKTIYFDKHPERFSDISLAKKEFGFEAETVLEKGLKETLKWHLKNYSIN